MLSAIGIKLIAGGLLVLAIVGGVFWFIEHERAVGAEAQRAKQEAADALWMKGAVENASQVQAYWQSYLDGLAISEKSRAQQKSEAVRLSAANDNRSCFDAAAASRLRARGALQPSGASGARPAGTASPLSPRR